MCYSFVYVGVFWGGCLANFQYIIMAAFNALGTRGAIFLLHQFRGLQVSFGLQGSRKPGLYDVDTSDIISLFQSTRLSRASTAKPVILNLKDAISIHKALASLDWKSIIYLAEQTDFNTQGSREPRQEFRATFQLVFLFQSTRLSRASTTDGFYHYGLRQYFNPQGSREPRQRSPQNVHLAADISIHKALASLDGYK